MKLSPKLKKIIGAVAPTLGLALGGPLGGMAGQLVMGALGVSSDDEALALLEGDPDSLLKLKTAQMDFEKRMAELDVDIEKITQLDRADARALAAKTSLMPQIVLSSLFIVGYFVVLGLFFSASLVVPTNEAFILMLGVLTAGVPMILAFWLGSSSGSKTKTDALAGAMVR